MATSDLIDKTHSLPLSRACARMIVRNWHAYPQDRVREAAVWVLGSFSATSEDIRDAAHALDNLPQQQSVINSYWVNP